MRVKIAAPEHQVAYQDICALVNKHADGLSSLELLAVASNMVGKLVALQDQRAISSELAMETVVQNIERGNKQVIDDLMQNKGRG